MGISNYLTIYYKEFVCLVFSVNFVVMELITDQEELRDKVRSRLPQRREVAKEIGISFGQFSRFMSGTEVGASTILKINSWLSKKQKS